MFLRNGKLRMMMMDYVMVIFFILTSGMVILLMLISPYAAQLSLPLSVSSSHSCAGVAAAAGEIAKDRSIWQLWNLILFP